MFEYRRGIFSCEFCCFFSSCVSFTPERRGHHWNACSSARQHTHKKKREEKKRNLASKRFVSEKNTKLAVLAQVPQLQLFFRDGFQRDRHHAKYTESRVCSRKEKLRYAHKSRKHAVGPVISQSPFKIDGGSSSFIHHLPRPKFRPYRHRVIIIV